MIIYLNPKLDRLIIALYESGYDYKTLFLSVIKAENGQRSPVFIRLDETIREEMLAVKDEKIRVAIPDSEITGNVADMLHNIDPEDRPGFLKELVRLNVRKGDAVSRYIYPAPSFSPSPAAGQAANIAALTSARDAAPSGQAEQQSRPVLSFAASAPNRDNASPVPASGETPAPQSAPQSAAGIASVADAKSEARPSSSPASARLHIKPARQPGHYYIESNDYLIDVNNVDADPCKDLSDRIRSARFKTVTELLVHDFEAVNGYLKDHQAAEKQGVPYDIESAMAAHPPKTSFDQIIQKWIAKNEQWKEERERAAKQPKLSTADALTNIMRAGGMKDFDGALFLNSIGHNDNDPAEPAAEEKSAADTPPSARQSASPDR